MSTGRALAMLVGQLLLVIVALVVAVRFLAPRRPAPAIDYPALTVRAAETVQAWGRRHGTFRGVDSSRAIVPLPVGTGLLVDVRADSSAVVEVRTTTGRCRIVLALTDTVPGRPVCRESASATPLPNKR